MQYILFFFKTYRQLQCHYNSSGAAVCVSVSTVYSQDTRTKSLMSWSSTDWRLDDGMNALLLSCFRI